MSKSRGEAMDRVQAEIEQRMEMVLHDWELYGAGKRAADRPGESAQP
jgi:hypothetical protein